MELKNIAGWNQTEADWQGYLEFEPEGSFVEEVGGQPAGTATTLRYGDGVAWIGMVLVHPTYCRLGIGTQLHRRCIAYLQGRGTRCIKLDATPMGERVYLPLGFREEYDLTRYEGAAPPAALALPESIWSFSAAELPDVARMDADAFGADRRRACGPNIRPLEPTCVERGKGDIH
jgi:GNAT superfamily N-acetyltransferase